VGSLLGELALGTHIILLIILETSSSAYRSGVLAPKGKVRTRRKFNTIVYCVSVDVSPLILVRSSPRHEYEKPSSERFGDVLVLHAATGSSVEPAEIITFAALKPPTDFCRRVLG
jgi:hypothetical protein